MNLNTSHVLGARDLRNALTAYIFSEETKSSVTMDVNLFIEQHNIHNV